jgi:hypothetical protein
MRSDQLILNFALKISRDTKKFLRDDILKVRTSLGLVLNGSTALLEFISEINAWENF